MDDWHSGRERGRSSKHIGQHEWLRPRHRAAGTYGESTVTVRKDAGCDALPEGAAPQRSFMADIRTPALVMAAIGLLVLGLVGRWVSDTEQAEPPRPAAKVEVPRADATEFLSLGTPTSTIGRRGAMPRVLASVLDSDCRRLVRARQQFTTLTISAENSCE